MLKAIVSSQAASQNSRDIANKTIAHISSVRQTRLQTQAGSANGDQPANGGPPANGQPHIRPQGIVPSYVFQEVLKSETASEESKERAKKHLASMGDIKAAKVRPATHEAPPQAMRLYRRLYDSQQSTRQPGKKLFDENHLPDNPDPYALQVYNNFGSSFKFFSEVLGRNSIDDNGMDLIGSVHFDEDNGRTPGYDNAFWDGQQMCFGDGDPEIFSTFTEDLDITGHELTHGVTALTANLPYEYQSGALNESMSDVFGSMIKQYTPNPKQKAVEADWLIGEGIFQNDDGARALRDMANPGTAYKDNKYIGSDPQPEDMDGYVKLPNTEEGDCGGVHINSGIPNRAFYLVATSVGDYSWEPAGKIWYAALTDPALEQVDTRKTFKQFANLTIKHAQTIGGTAAQTAVEEAWKTVKVL
jgi:Zn-dependent metalloprotease